MTGWTGYRDRTEAGRRLADALRETLSDAGDTIILALPRGGVPVAAEIASALDLPLDVLVVRKLGLPSQPELAMGAIASGGIRMLNREVISSAGVDDATVARVEERETRELLRREQEYRGDRIFPSLRDRTVVLVDDGVATGSTLRAAILAVRSHHPAQIIVAVPVGPPDGIRELEEQADRVICPLTPDAFVAIGSWYRDFEQLSDDRVRGVLSRARAEGAS